MTRARESGVEAGHPSTSEGSGAVTKTREKESVRERPPVIGAVLFDYLVYLNMLPNLPTVTHRTVTSLKVLNVESRWEGLLQLIGLVGVMDAQGVQVLAAPDLELGHVSGLLDLDGARVLPAGGQQEVLDLVNLLWLRCSEGKKRERSESGRLNEAKVSRGESAARRTASWGSGEALGHLRESGATRPLTREGPEGTPPLQPRRGWNDPTDGASKTVASADGTPAGSRRSALRPRPRLSSIPLPLLVLTPAHFTHTHSLSLTYHLGSLRLACSFAFWSPSQASPSPPPKPPPPRPPRDFRKSL